MRILCGKLRYRILFHRSALLLSVRDATEIRYFVNIHYSARNRKRFFYARSLQIMRGLSVESDRLLSQALCFRGWTETGHPYCQSSNARTQYSGMTSISPPINSPNALYLLLGTFTAKFTASVFRNCLSIFLLN